jgi:hypothetical protein
VALAPRAGVHPKRQRCSAGNRRCSAPPWRAERRSREQQRIEQRRLPTVDEERSAHAADDLARHTGHVHAALAELDAELFELALEQCEHCCVRRRADALRRGLPLRSLGCVRNGDGAQFAVSHAALDRAVLQHGANLRPARAPKRDAAVWRLTPAVEKSVCRPQFAQSTLGFVNAIVLSMHVGPLAQSVV